MRKQEGIFGKVVRFVAFEGSSIVLAVLLGIFLFFGADSTKQWGATELFYIAIGLILYLWLQAHSALRRQTDNQWLQNVDFLCSSVPLVVGGFAILCFVAGHTVGRESLPAMMRYEFTTLQIQVAFLVCAAALQDLISNSAVMDELDKRDKDNALSSTIRRDLDSLRSKVEQLEQLVHAQTVVRKD